MKQAYLSVIDYIAALPDLWQVAAYVFLALLVVGLIRALPIAIQIIIDIIKFCFELALKYTGRGILYLLKFAFRPVAPLFWALWSLTGIPTPAERRAQGYKWIPDMGWYKDPRKQTQEQPGYKTPQERKKEMEDIKAKAERFIQYYDTQDKTIKTLPFLMPTTDDSKPPQEKPKPQPESITDPFKELEGMIGLKPVKAQVTDLANLVRMQNRRVKAGLPRTNISYHLVFTGNPGTGKTTVARIVGRIFKDLAVLRKGHLVETDRAGLIGEYIGHTAKLVEKAVTKAMDGLLFIDEAYALVVPDSPTDFGAEAIATLLRLMENHRDRLVVIAAGYPDEMESFINSNPGLKSRFKTVIHFPDYSPDELHEIFLKICEDEYYRLAPEAEQKLKIKTEKMFNERDRNFGNGRAIRNLFEECLARQAKRIVALRTHTRQDLITLASEDIPDIQANS